MANLQPPLPQNPISECFVWREWLQGVAKAAYTVAGASGVSQIVAGANVFISSTGGSGTGIVTINAIVPGGTVTSVGVASTGAYAAAFTVSASPVTLSGTINITPNVFATGSPGVVPASGGGTSNFLRADGTWAAPPGGGGAVTQIVAGSNISVTPVGGTGVVTIDSLVTTGPTGPMGPAVYLEALESDEPITIPGPAGSIGATGPAGTSGTQGPAGPAVYLEAPEADEPMPFPGPPGAQGVAGITTIQTTTAFVYLDADPPDDPPVIPGVQGATGSAGSTGSTGAQGPVGPAVYLEAPDADETIGIPGPAGVAGATGSVGSQGPIGPAVYLEADYQEAEFFHIQGNQGVTGNTGAQGVPGISMFVVDGDPGEDGLVIPGPQGAQGPQGTAGSSGSGGASGAHFTTDIPDAEVENIAVSFNRTPSPLGLLGIASPGTGPFSIGSTVTFTSGNRTLPAQSLATGTIFRIIYYITLTPISSATARNLQIAPYWGATQLGINTVAVLASSAVVVRHRGEVIITANNSGSLEVTHSTIGLSGGVLSLILPVTGAFAVGGANQAVDLRFAFSVVVAGDSVSADQVIIERLA